MTHGRSKSIKDGCRGWTCEVLGNEPESCKCCPYKESTEIPTRSIHDTWNHWILTESASTVEIASKCKKEVASRPSSSNHRNWWVGSGVGGGAGRSEKTQQRWWEPMLWSSCWIFWRFWNVLIMCNVSAESSWQFQWRSNHVNSSWLLSMFFLGFKALVPSLSVQNRLQQDEGWRNTWWIFFLIFEEKIAIVHQSQTSIP